MPMSLCHSSESQEFVCSIFTIVFTDCILSPFVFFTASMMYQYFVKIVPTVYVKTDGEVSSTDADPDIDLLSLRCDEFK